jgi:hypothetical protein
MPNFTIEIQAPAIVAAIDKLISTITPKAPMSAPLPQTPAEQAIRQQYQPVAPVNPTPAAPITGAVNTAPGAAPAPTSVAPTVYPSNPAPATAPSANQVPTTAPTYQMDDLARAAAQLMDAGKQQELLGLLAKFNVQALTQLPQKQYGAFATELRQMGAKL